MSYTGASLIGGEVAERERQLLQAGLSYHAIAKATSVKVGTLKERNRLVYRIDIYQAFRERIERDGLPDTLTVSDEFGYYFTGLFDGEGTIILWHRNRNRPEFRLGIQIVLRNDDANVLEYIHEQLGGVLLQNRRQSGPTNPSLAWRLEGIKQLAEQVVPLFDKYPLRTKKRREYEIWRPMVIERYLATLGGETARGGRSEFEPCFLDAVARIKAVRQYPSSL